MLELCEKHLKDSIMRSEIANPLHGKEMLWKDYKGYKVVAPQDCRYLDCVKIYHPETLTTMR
jgi:hypothetical protein